MGEIFVKKPGIYTTVQDGGRFGYQSYGIPTSGVMDRYAYWFANYLLDNSIDEAVLEVTLLGPEIEFGNDTIIAITGGDLSPNINRSPVEMWRTISVKKGDVLSFGEAKSGARSYIAFSGGIDVPLVMGSKSTYVRGKFGGHMGRLLKSGDILKIGDIKPGSESVDGKLLSPRYIPNYSKDISLRVVMGPQTEKFTEKGIETFLNSGFICSSQNDRMGYRLEGETIETVSGADIVSDGIAFGAIQVTNSGSPIIMMSDRQTVGGYAKIGCVISSDLPKLAQAKCGDKINFSAVSVNEAQDILLKTGRL